MTVTRPQRRRTIVVSFRFLILALLPASGVFLSPAASAGIIGVNVDAIQPFSPSANNFEIVIRVPNTETVSVPFDIGTNVIDGFPSGPMNGLPVELTRLPDDSTHNRYQIIFRGGPILPDNATIYHFGFQLDSSTFSGFAPREITAGGDSTFWTDNNNQLPLLPTPTSAAATVAAPGPTEFVTTFARTRFSGPSGGNAYQGETDVWTEIEVPTDALSVVKFENNSLDTFSLEQTGFLVTDTEIPLRELNLIDLPPSAFHGTRVPGGTQLAPGQEIVAAVIPEPGTYLLLVPLLGMLWCRRLRPPGDGAVTGVNEG